MIKNLFILVLIVVICLVAFLGRSERRVILSMKAPQPIGPYSQAILSENTLYVSGQIALKQDGTLDTSGIENECRRVMDNIKAIVEESGKTMQDAAKTTIYLTDLGNFQNVNEVYKTYFEKDPPARETVEVRSLPRGAHIEISMILN
jgi:2-iminobutanoate/2-iminopropanoate deaminase